MSLQIIGLGTSVPKFSYNTELDIQTAKAVLKPTEEQKTWLPEIYKNTTIERRFNSLDENDFKNLLQKNEGAGTSGWRGPSIAERMRYFERDAYPIAIASATEAIKNSGWSQKEITHLISVSCTGIVTPGIDIALLEGINLRGDIGRTHIGSMGCQAAINAFRIASALAKDSNEKILISAVELCSLHYYCSWSPTHIIANSLFGDGAAAVTCADSQSMGDRPKRSWKLAAVESTVIPNTKKHMGWLVGDFGFEITLNKKVPDIIKKFLKPWIENWLGKLGMNLKDIHSWAVHPGGPKILDSVQESLELDANALDYSRTVLRNYGNMSSPTVLFVVKEMMKADVDMPCLMLGFGPGLSVEAALWNI